jgi:hypothetical protein
MEATRGSVKWSIPDLFTGIAEYIVINLIISPFTHAACTRANKVKGKRTKPTEIPHGLSEIKRGYV